MSSGPMAAAAKARNAITSLTSYKKPAAAIPCRSSFATRHAASWVRGTSCGSMVSALQDPVDRALIGVGDRIAVVVAGGCEARAPAHYRARRPVESEATAGRDHPAVADPP